MPRGASGVACGTGNGDAIVIIRRREAACQTASNIHKFLTTCDRAMLCRRFQCIGIATIIDIETVNRPRRCPLSARRMAHPISVNPRPGVRLFGAGNRRARLGSGITAAMDRTRHRPGTGAGGAPAVSRAVAARPHLPDAKVTSL